MWLAMQTGVAAMENSTAVPQKITNRIPIQSRNSTSGYTLRRIKQGLREIFVHPCSQQHYSQHPQVDVTQMLSTDEWIKKMCYIHIVEYYSALKRKEILTHAPIWAYPEDIILSEIKHLREDKYSTGVGKSRFTVVHMENNILIHNNIRITSLLHTHNCELTFAHPVGFHYMKYLQ